MRCSSQEVGLCQGRKGVRVGVGGEPPGEKVGPADSHLVNTKLVDELVKESEESVQEVHDLNDRP